jgi:hypothetical protein
VNNKGVYMSNGTVERKSLDKARKRLEIARALRIPVESLPGAPSATLKSYLVSDEVPFEPTASVPVPAGASGRGIDTAFARMPGTGKLLVWGGVGLAALIGALMFRKKGKKKK